MQWWNNMKDGVALRKSIQQLFLHGSMLRLGSASWQLILNGWLGDEKRRICSFGKRTLPIMPYSCPWVQWGRWQLRRSMSLSSSWRTKMSSVSSDQRKSMDDGRRKRSHVFQMWRLIMWRRLYTVKVSSRSLVTRTEKVYKACSSWRPSKGRVSHDVQCMILSWYWRIKSGMALRQTKIRTSRCCSGRGTSCHDSRKSVPRVDG